MREYRKIERSPEEQARIKALRERFQRDKPTIEELEASGEYTPAGTMGEVMEKRRKEKEERDKESR